jgi:fructose-bisphosphate aldolase class II
MTVTICAARAATAMAGTPTPAPASPANGETEMARITLRQLLDHAAENDYGVPAFNINNMEQALAIMEAAKTDSPVIIQASRVARAPMPTTSCWRHMIDALCRIYPHIPVCVHQDHGNEPAPA